MSGHSWYIMMMMYGDVYTHTYNAAVSRFRLFKKSLPFYFCDNFLKCKPIQLIFGRNEPQKIWNKLTTAIFLYFSLHVPNLHLKMKPTFLSVPSCKNSNVVFQTFCDDDYDRSYFLQSLRHQKCHSFHVMNDRPFLWLIYYVIWLSLNCRMVCIG